MKSIIIKTLPYLTVFLLLNVFVYKTSRFYDQQRKYLNRIENVINVKPKVVFLGDSHVESIHLLDLPENIGNLAFGADGIKEMFIKTLILAEYNTDLECVFICTEPQMFNTSVSSNSTFLNRYLLQLSNYKEVYNKSTLNLMTEKIPFFNDDYLRYFLKSTYTKIRNSDDNANKREWSDASEIEKQNMAAISGVADHKALMTNNDELEIYKEMVETLQKMNIKVIGIRFPVNKHYISQCKEEDLRKVNRFITDLNLDQNLDYTLKINNSDNFINEDHLNKYGMLKLSKLIYQDTGIKLDY